MARRLARQRGPRPAGSARHARARARPCPRGPRPLTARIHAERDAGGGTRLATLRAAAPWTPRALPPGARERVARVALVQSAATLVSGDDVAIELAVGPGAALDVVETGATVAHAVRGRAPARLTVRIALGEGARLRWLARPLVLAAGCAVERTTAVELAPGAVALLRETLVLGRSGERPGVLHAATRATLLADTWPAAPAPSLPPPAIPLLVETIDTADLATLRSSVVAHTATTLDSLMLLGARGDDVPWSAQLAGPGTLWRALHGRGVDPDTAAAPVAAAWAAAALGDGWS